MLKCYFTEVVVIVSLLTLLVCKSFSNLVM